MSEGQSKISRVLGNLWKETKGLVEFNPKVPLNEINKKKVADTIVTHLGFLPYNSPDRWKDYDFSIIDVLNYMGYEEGINLYGGSGHFEKFRKEYLATRSALRKLVEERALGEIELEEADRDNERLYYEVYNDAKLRELTK